MFFKQIIAGKYTAVLSYGSLSSNHCRIISSLCTKHQISCYIAYTISDININFNRKLINLANTTVIQCQIDAYQEIYLWEEEQQLSFDYIFVASGTGSTHAGLILGQLLNPVNNNKTKIIGISVARERTYGTQIIRENIKGYPLNHGINLATTEPPPIYFEDQYIERAYGVSNAAIQRNIKKYVPQSWNCFKFYIHW